MRTNNFINSIFIYTVINYRNWLSAYQVLLVPYRALTLYYLRLELDLAAPKNRTSGPKRWSNENKKILQKACNSYKVSKSYLLLRTDQIQKTKL